MDKNKANVPKIRFPRFTNPWEQRKLGEFLFESLIPGTNGSVANKLTVKLWGKGVVPKNEKYRGSSHTKYYIRHSGQLIYGKLDFLHGAFGIVPEELDGYESTIDAPAFDISRDINHNFLISLILRKEFYLKEGMIANGSRRAKRIHEDTFLKMTPFFPSLQEQNKIGDFFKQLDEAITLHQRKLNHSQDKKKSLLQKMFPKNGEDFPELRFPEFTDPWEQRKLGEVTNSYSGGTPSVGKSEYYDGDIPFIRSAEINSDITELFISESGLNNSSAKMVEIGDILYALYGATSGEVGISRITGAINQAILAIQPKNNYDSQFIMQWLRSEKQNIINKYLQGGQGNLSGSIVKNLQIEFPNYNEQVKIGKLFAQLDNLITLHQRKLNHLQEQKKALLQQMFI